MSDVFISYSRRDKEFVHILHDALEKSDKKTWVDWEDILPTSEWWQEIENAIAGSDTFIFVISPASIASEYCNKEVEYAFNLHKRILPIVRQDVTDITQVQAALSRHQWIFFRESDEFDISFQKLLEAIALDLSHIHAHTRLLVMAIEWDNKQRKNGFLLRGEDLEEAEKWLADSVTKSPKPNELQGTYIQSSRNVEDANQQANKILKKAARNGVLIAVISGVLGIVAIIVSATIAKNSLAIAEQAEQKVIESEQKNQTLKQKFNALESSYQDKVTLSKAELSRLQEQYRDDATKARENPNPVVESIPQSNNGIIYIQAPSEAARKTIQKLPSALTKQGFKATKIEVVGLAISPSTSQIRYFFKDSTTVKRATDLQQKLKEFGYKDFKIVYVKGFENKVKPEMMEIWFAKDAK